MKIVRGTNKQWLPIFLHHRSYLLALGSDRVGTTFNEYEKSALGLHFNEVGIRGTLSLQCPLQSRAGDGISLRFRKYRSKILIEFRVSISSTSYEINSAIDNIPLIAVWTAR